MWSLAGQGEAGELGDVRQGHLRQDVEGDPQGAARVHLVGPPRLGKPRKKEKKTGENIENQGKMKDFLSFLRVFKGFWSRRSPFRCRARAVSRRRGSSPPRW